MKETQRITIVTAILLGWCIFIGQAWATPNILFVMDISSTMTGKFPEQTKLNDQTKIQIIKDTMGSLLAEYPKEGKVGLEVFGHYGNKDCSAIELVNSVKSLDVSAILDNVETLSPAHGAAPLAKSLQLGADAFNSDEDEKIIVLISDTKDTCGGDPVATAKQLKENNISIYVVGLDVTEDEQIQLSSIAEAGGGEFYAVDNTKALEKILFTFKEKIVEKKPETEVVFRDDFNATTLAENWNIVKPSKNSDFTMKGKKNNLKKAGSILYFKQSLPEGDWAIEANLNSVPHTMAEVFELGLTNNSWSENILAQIYFDASDETKGRVVLKGIKRIRKSYSNFHKELLSFRSRNLQWRSDFFKQHVKSVTIKLEKTADKYVVSSKFEPVKQGDKALPLDWFVLHELNFQASVDDSLFIRTYSNTSKNHETKRVESGGVLNWLEIQSIK